MYIARLLKPSIALSISSSETILLPPDVGAKYTKFDLHCHTSGDALKHYAYHSNRFFIPVCLVNDSITPSGKPQYFSSYGLFDLSPT